MSVSPAMAEGLAESLRVLYGDAEQILLARIARALSQGLEAPDWTERKLAELQLVMARSRGDLDRLTPRAVEEIVQAILKAWNRGVATATADAQASRDLVAAVAEGANPAGLPAVQQLAAETASTVVSSHRAILRSTEDIYRQTIARSAPQVLLGTQTRREATQTALDSFADKGISGFTDKAGRRWGMDSYAEMATRTATGHAAIDGHVDRLERLGQDLVIVSDSPRNCPACAPWERKVLSLSGAPHVGEGVEVAGTLDEARAAGLMHPNCFPADTLVSVPTGVHASDARWYEGELVVIHTASGDELSVTPNHPVLTPEGWVAAGELQVGQHVLRYRPDSQGVVGVRPDEELVVARIGDVHEALRKTSAVPPVGVPSAAEQFHGDGVGDGDVEVVLAHSLLQDDGRADRGSESAFLGRGVRLADLLGGGPLGQDVGAEGHASDGVMGGGNVGRTHLGSFPGGAPQSSLRTADADSADAHPAGYGGLGDAEALGQVVLPLASEVTRDEVVDLGRREFAGHVYNLQSGAGWYVAGNIVVHNCTHTISAFFPGVTKIKPADNDPDGYAAKQRQRQIERHIREWKRRKAVALDDAAKAKADAKIKAWQAEARANVAQTGTKRLNYREQAGKAH